MMRLFLCASPLKAKPPAALQTQHYGFLSWEDYTIGPVSDWPDATTFRAARARFFETEMPVIMDSGEAVPYAPWFQIMPDVPFEQLASMPEAEWPDFPDCEDLLSQAQVIEIWAGPSSKEQVWLWQLCAALDQRGIARDKVELVQLARDSWDTPLTDAQWQAMYLGSADRALPPQAIAPDQWAQVIANWNAVCARPTPPDPALLQDPITARVFAHLRGRLPDPATGLGNLETRLLRATKAEWRKMAWVIAEAMAEGHDASDAVDARILQHMLQKLARMTPPLIEITSDSDTDDPLGLRHLRLRLTSDGAARQRILPPAPKRV